MTTRTKALKTTTAAERTTAISHVADIHLENIPVGPDVSAVAVISTGAGIRVESQLEFEISGLAAGCSEF